MADWKVSVERIDVFPHPDADKLQVARVGLYPLVVQRDNNYKNGDLVVFAPKRTILPEGIRDLYCNIDTGESYLKGGKIVKSIRLRGVLSEGVSIPLSYLEEKLTQNNITKEYPEFVGKKPEDIIGIDISKFLNMEENLPPISKQSFGGNLQPIVSTLFSRHDCENISIFEDEFINHQYDKNIQNDVMKSGNLYVTATVKYHGTQINIIRHKDGFVELSTKRMIGNDLTLTRSDNLYWKAWDLSKLEDVINNHFKNNNVQLMGEIIPVQGGFSYGLKELQIILFRIEIDNRRYSTWEVMNLTELEPFRKYWAKILYEGEFNLEEIKKVAKLKEQVSGRELHVNEGVVIEPKFPRKSRKRFFPLYIKYINPKYKGEDDDDAIS